MTTTELKKEDLKSFIKTTERRIEKSKASLAENFTYYLPWVGEELYKDEFKIKYYESILTDLTDMPEDNNTIEIWIKRLSDFTSRSYNVRENSSGSLHREVSTWKFIATMELIEEMSKIN